MEANEAQELQENAEHGEHEGALRPVAFTMSVLAVLVAVTTVLGHRTHTDAVLNQAKASDKWNEYQAVKIRSSDLTAAQKLRSLFTLTDNDKIAKAAITRIFERAQAGAELSEGDVLGSAPKSSERPVGPLRKPRDLQPWIFERARLRRLTNTRKSLILECAEWASKAG